MNTSPSIDDLLAGVIVAVDDEILPALDNAKSQATAQMIQSIVQGIRQLLPVSDIHLVDEHNAMTAVLRDTAAALGGTDGAAADRIRGRAETLGQTRDLPPPFNREDARTAHRELGEALVATLPDLDELQRAGEPDAAAALEILRAHLGSRYVRDVATFTVGEGMLGRG